MSLAPGSSLNKLLQDLVDAGGRIEVAEFEFEDEVREGEKLGLVEEHLPPGWGITKFISLTQDGRSLMGMPEARKPHWIAALFAPLFGR